MSKETYALKAPVTLGKLVITELQIDRVAKGKYWRVAQQPMAVGTDSDAKEMTMHITNGESEIALMQALTGQPLAVIDELGLADFDYLYGAAVEMLGNFSQSKNLPTMEAISTPNPTEPEAPELETEEPQPRSAI